MFSMREISEMESTYLNLVDFKLKVSSAEYAKYYFILRKFAKAKERSY
jgi:hypothetical protein